jgi:hypothetical protein
MPSTVATHTTTKAVLYCLTLVIEEAELHNALTSTCGYAAEL